jgi:hypothetical protein
VGILFTNTSLFQKSVVLSLDFLHFHGLKLVRLKNPFIPQIRGTVTPLYCHSIWRFNFDKLGVHLYHF